MLENKLHLLSIESATDTKFVETHNCDSSPLPDALHVLRADSAASYPEAGWVLVNVWYANPDQVEFGEAENVGEIIQVSVVGIRFCPFCGTLLE